MAGVSGGKMEEAILYRHYAKVPHIIKSSRHNWKCLLQGYTFSWAFFHKNYIEKHWRKDHVDCHLQITQKLPSRPKTIGVSRKSDKKKLIVSCDKYFRKILPTLYQAQARQIGLLLRRGMQFFSDKFFFNLHSLLKIKFMRTLTKITTCWF